MTQKRKSVKNKQVTKPKSSGPIYQDASRITRQPSGQMPPVQSDQPSRPSQSQPSVQSEQQTASNQPSARKRSVKNARKSHARSHARPRKGRLWWKIALAVVAVCIIGTCVVVSWERWWRYDDLQDFQGSWVDARNNVSVTIDADEIHLSDEVAYPYEIDTWNKSVSFSFAQLNGEAMYLFSPDRTTLYIVEGENRKVVEDVLRQIGFAETPNYYEDERATVLVRSSAATNVVQ